MAMDSIDVTGDIMYFSLSDKNILFVKKNISLTKYFHVGFETCTGNNFP